MLQGGSDVVTAALKRYASIIFASARRSVPTPTPSHTAGVLEGLDVDVADATASPRPSAGMDESYRLEIRAPRARLSAPSAFGALRGLETFSQLGNI